MKGRPRSYAIAPAVVLALAVVAVIAAVATAGTGSAGSTADAARATAKYRDVEVAEHAGYGLLKDKRGIACIAMGMPGMGAMGIHFAKNTLVGDPAINPESPEALVYEPLAHGKLRLAALEYVVIAKAWNAHHGAPPALFGHRFNYTPAGNRFGLPAFYSLHAWLFEHNPSGEFSTWNPNVKCPAGAKGGYK